MKTLPDPLPAFSRRRFAASLAAPFMAAPFGYSITGAQGQGKSQKPTKIMPGSCRCPPLTTLDEHIPPIVLTGGSFSFEARDEIEPLKQNKKYKSKDPKTIRRVRVLAMDGTTLYDNDQNPDFAQIKIWFDNIVDPIITLKTQTYLEVESDKANLDFITESYANLPYKLRRKDVKQIARVTIEDSRGSCLWECYSNSKRLIYHILIWPPH